MKYLVTGLLAAVLLAGCAFNRQQGDTADNRYQQTPVHADADALYVGEWTAATRTGIKSVKIKPDGRVKVCLSPSSGTANGKVYLDGGAPALILDSGATINIVDASSEFLLLDIYGHQEKYHAGLVEPPCRTSFKNFQ